MEVEAFLEIWAESHMTYLDFLTGKWEQSFILPARKCLGENPCCTIFERSLQGWGKQGKKKRRCKILAKRHSQGYLMAASIKHILG